MGELEISTAMRLDLAPDAALADAYLHCASIAKRAAGNFYYAFMVLPRAQRNGIQALYAFCRAGDDSADDPLQHHDRLSALQRLKERLDLCYEGMYCDLMTLALADAVRRFQFDRNHFDELLKGIESDLSPARYITQEDLRIYCYRVASTVGLLCIKIFGADSDASRKYAIELGIGMQVTNILRDLREDFERGRLYIPETDLKLFNLDRETFFQPEKAGQRKELIVHMAAIARNHFEEAAKSLPKPFRGKLIAARIMGGIYETILQRIESDPGAEKRVELSRLEKLGIVRRILVEN